MNGPDFALQPFFPSLPHRTVKITGHLARRAALLAIRYDLNGPLAELVIPGLAGLPSRKHRLWEETCFELFLGVKDSPQYWEFNLSPAGDWNVYRFDGYRQGMTEETAFTSLPLSIRHRPDSLAIALELEIVRIVGADQPLAVALAAVIKSRDHGLTYWALAHPGPRPDFHRRDSFLLEL
jgi:hypothetical protein